MLPVMIRDLKNKFYTDAEIEFIDDQTSATISIHKICLATNSEYFDKLFHFNRTDSYQIIVPSVDCAVDIVNEFYDIENNNNDWLYIIKYLETQNFFGLPVSISLLYDIIVPPNKFELFLNLIEILFFTFESVTKDHLLIRSIQRNLPVDSDTKKLPLILFEEINKKSYSVVISCDTHLKIIDLYIDKQFRINTTHDSNIIFSLDRRLCCLFSPTYHEPNNIFIHKIGSTKHTMLEIPTPIIPYAMCFSNKYLIVIGYVDDGDDVPNFRICCYEIATSQCIWSVNNCGYISRDLPLYAPNQKYIAYGYELMGTRCIHLLNSTNGQTIREFHFKDRIAYGISFDNKLIYITDSTNTLQIWSVESGELVRKLKLLHYWKAFLYDSESIITINHDKLIYFYKISTGELYRTITFLLNVNRITFSSDGKSLLVITDPNRECHVIDLATNETTCIYSEKTGDLVDFYENNY